MDERDRTTLTDDELVDKCRALISDFCKNGRESRLWYMSIPARPNEDPDILFHELMNRFNALRQNTHPPLMEDCPECGGSGWTNKPDSAGVVQIVNCSNTNCIKGKVWKYYTPVQWLQWYKDNGLPVPELGADTPVWVRVHADTLWVATGIQYSDFGYGQQGPYLRFPGQPKPPKEYKNANP